MQARNFHGTGLTYLFISAAGIIFTCAAAAMRGNGEKSFRYNLIGGVTAVIGFAYIAFVMLIHGQDSGYMSGNIIVGLISLCVIVAEYTFSPLSQR